MTIVVCENCGHSYGPLPPTSASKALVSESKFADVAPELREAERAKCPKCGHQQRAQTYRFFGILTSNGVRAMLAAIVLGMLALAVWWRIRG
jgi:predicted RNA-binding Zn-ribbon protein involved in translation (DUF1610 family)